MVQVIDEKGSVLFECYGNGHFTFTTPKDGKYQLYLLPYTVSDNKKIFGDKIKLPTVIAEGKRDILDEPWWDD